MDYRILRTFKENRHIPRNVERISKISSTFKTVILCHVFTYFNVILEQQSLNVSNLRVRLKMPIFFLVKPLSKIGLSTQLKYKLDMNEHFVNVNLVEDVPVMSVNVYICTRLLSLLWNMVLLHLNFAKKTVLHKIYACVYSHISRRSLNTHALTLAPINKIVREILWDHERLMKRDTGNLDSVLVGFGLLKKSTIICLWHDDDYIHNK